VQLEIDSVIDFFIYEFKMYSVDADNGGIRHKNGELALSLEQREGRNRCVIAKKRFQRGDVVLQEVPYSLIIPANYTAVACMHCGHVPDATKGEQIYGVAADDPIRYCSQQCLQADATLHALEARAVQAFQELSIEGNTEALRLIIRIAALKRQEILNMKLTLGVPDYPLWGSSNLYAHVMSLEAPTGNIDAEALTDIQAVAQVMSELLDDADISLSDHDVNHLLLAIQSNAHRVVDADKRCVGLGTFPLTSMLNHSCSPNCSHHFIVRQGEPPALVMQAIADINEGDELCYNYIPLYQSTERRRQQLSTAYSFTCSCQRCSESTESITQAEEGSSIFNFQTSNKFPRDHILSDVNIISSSDSAIDESTLDFDTVVPVDGKVLNAISTEISMCNNLLASASSNPKVCKSVNKKLVKFFSDKNKAGALHPCHELVLNAYVTSAKVSDSLLSQCDGVAGDGGSAGILTVEEVQQFSQASVGLGALALGCIIKFTHVRNDDVAELEAIIGRGLMCLEESGGIVSGERQCRDEFVQLALTALTSLNYTWATSAVVSELLGSACSFATAECASGAPLSLSKAFTAASAVSETRGSSH